MQHRRLVRCLIFSLLPAVLAVATPGSAETVPPSPPHPGEDHLEDGRRGARSLAERVEELSDRLASAESRITGASARVALKMENTNKARVDLQRAERGWVQARQAAGRAAAEADAAARRVEHQRTRLDKFAAGSYRQGSKLGSLTAFFGVKGPEELLDRAEMLAVVSSSEFDVLGQLERARREKAAIDTAARQAAREAGARQAAAVKARDTAEAAEADAVAAQRAQLGEVERLKADKQRVQAELAAARSRAVATRPQADRLEAQRREATAQAPVRPKPLAAPAPPSHPVRSKPVEAVIQRALSQVGVSYAWGGGDASGPTLGVRDGGVADAHGDYQKVGFDCSGLMIYAFAAAGSQLEHYSGYQYRAGRQVPVSEMRRGDMLFWQDNGQIHHVALYLGHGRMVEAPYSGSDVRVTTVRYGGIAPYAVRML